MWLFTRGQQLFCGHLLAHYIGTCIAVSTLRELTGYIATHAYELDIILHSNSKEREIVMLVRIYGMLWLAAAIVAMILFLASNLMVTAVVIFNIVAFGLVFMGMMGVLHATVTHPAPSKSAVEKRMVNVVEVRGRVRHSAKSVSA